ncbi:MAG: hypothetical protein ACRD1P_00715 [Thermoanaerobaculia bacterium]
MKGINWGRVFLGGIVAGIVVNISEFLLHGVVLKAANEEMMKALGKTVSMTGATTAVWVIWGFVFGIAAVWLYAGIRPRYGAGPATAAKAGIAAWFFAHFLCGVVFMNMGLSPSGSMTVPLIWTLVESIVATVIGAWLYKEEGA